MTITITIDVNEIGSLKQAKRLIDYYIKQQQPTLPGFVQSNNENNENKEK